MKSIKTIGWENLQFLIRKRTGIYVFALLMCGSVFSQVPNWVDPEGQYTNSMIGTFKVSDECVPSDDPEDIVAVFDIQGNIRGVRTTSNSNRAFIVIRGEGSPEALYFKVYHHDTDKVYNIYNTSITFATNSSIASPSNPMVLNFDSNPQGADGGPDQEIFNMTSTTLSATGSGVWSIVEGAGGSLGNASSATTSFSGVLGTSYLLSWTLDNAAGCIGESDEVVVVFVIPELENISRTCNDGLDNDGDRLTDCNDPDCGRPDITAINVIQPTPIDCNSTQSDGSITIIQTGADSFSIDLGNTFQTSNSFSNLNVGLYNVWLKSNTQGCVLKLERELENLIDRIKDVLGIQVSGPTVLCKGSEDIRYEIDMPNLSSLNWSYTGTDVSFTGSNEVTHADFGSTATEGSIIATMSSTCTSVSDTLDIVLASDFLCSFSICPLITNITPGVIESAMSPQVYRAGMDLMSNASLTNNNYEFTAGNTLQFNSGFSIDQGLSFIADIKACTN